MPKQQANFKHFTEKRDLNSKSVRLRRPLWDERSLLWLDGASSYWQSSPLISPILCVFQL